MITEKQRELRRNFIGSSDCATILGLNPWANVGDLWLEKTGRAVPDETSAAAETGNRLEAVLIEYAAEQLGIGVEKIEFPQTIIHSSGLLCANLDGQVMEFSEGAAIVECKFTGLGEEWGEEPTDVPARVAAQCLFQMGVCGPRYKIAYVPVALANFNRLSFKLYQVPRDDEAANGILETCMDWMRRYVKADVRPPDSVPSLDVLKRVRRQPSKVVKVASDLLDRYEAAKEVAKKAKEDTEAAQAALVAALADAEGGETDDGRKFTYLMRHRCSYMVQESDFRQLAVLKTKKENPCLQQL